MPVQVRPPVPSLSDIQGGLCYPALAVPDAASAGGSDMFARITRFKMKPGSRDAATEKMEELKSRIMGMPGMVSFTNVMNEDGSGVVVDPAGGVGGAGGGAGLLLVRGEPHRPH